ncbi:NAD-dependent epimerase/dehydratase family protein [Bosea sp. (in: a-proteobacteria)]|uniref:NAD-dependent epimerase/dehydratase family protein n=1 Tax=Bosea sp. (in: a-proteobacteria) TaxID=1871050 RepID=UPI003F6FDDCC
MAESVLITGATGFVGGEVTKLCLSRGYRTSALVRPGRAGAVPFGVNAIEVDLCDETALITAVRAANPTAILHLAAYGVAPHDRDPLMMQQINVGLAGALVRSAARCGAVVVSAGSNAEYAETSGPGRVDEHTALNAQHLYGASKAAGGLLALATASALSLPMRHMRVFNVYGAGEAPHRLLPSLVAQRNGHGRIPLSEGRQIRDYLHVADVAAGLLAAAERLRSGALRGADALNLCSGEGISIRDFSLLAAEALGIESQRLGFGDLPMRPGEIARLVGNPDRMKIDLGWAPTYDAATGIRAVIRHYDTSQADQRAGRSGVSQ